MADFKKLQRLKEIGRKNLEKNLLDVQLKGQDHYVFINDRQKAQVVFKDGQWVTEHIRTSILKFNYEVDVFFHILNYYYYPELDKLLKNDNRRKNPSSQKKSC